MSTRERDRRPGAEEIALTKVIIRVADKLGVSQRRLASIIGVSEPVISRMRNGSFVLERNSKPFELSVLFARLYSSLDAAVGGDDPLQRKSHCSPDPTANTGLSSHP